MIDERDLELSDSAAAIAPALVRIWQLEKILGDAALHIYALVPAGRIQGRECITVATRDADSMPLTVAMVQAIPDALPLLDGTCQVAVRLPSEDSQVDLWRADETRVEELELTIYLRSIPRSSDTGVHFATNWGSSPDHSNLVFVFSERPAGWPP